MGYVNNLAAILLVKRLEVMKLHGRMVKTLRTYASSIRHVCVGFVL